jgi:glycosyltransferase involved in cell wall biosynthesis
MSPMKMFEYMASGVPMIASDLPALREVLAHEVNCLLVPPASVHAWLAAHDRLSDNPVLGRTIAAASYVQYQTYHTWSRRAACLLEAARSL